MKTIKEDIENTIRHYLKHLYKEELDYHQPNYDDSCVDMFTKTGKVYKATLLELLCYKQMI